MTGRRSRFGKVMGLWSIGLVVPMVVIFAAGLIAITYSIAARNQGDTRSTNIDPVASCLPAEAVPENARNFSTEQLSNAAVIVTVGKQMGLPPEGWVVAIATSIQESGLRNLDGGHWDSAGLFQQRPGAGWGSHGQVTTPTYAATQFYQHLREVPDWQQMSLTRAAQTVQRSAFPGAYAAHEHAARYLVGVVAQSGCGGGGGSGRAWVVPTDGTCTSRSGRRGGQHHQGLDLAAPIGTTIVAPQGGTVIDSGAASGFGLWVRIEHSGGVVTTYGHIHRSHVDVGQAVEAGQPIAEVGNRGQSTGPHLHYEVNPGDGAVAPSEFYQQHNAPPLC